MRATLLAAVLVLAPAIAPLAADERPEATACELSLEDHSRWGWINRMPVIAATEAEGRERAIDVACTTARPDEREVCRARAKDHARWRVEREKDHVAVDVTITEPRSRLRVLARPAPGEELCAHALAVACREVGGAPDDTELSGYRPLCGTKHWYFASMGPRTVKLPFDAEVEWE